MRSWCCQTIGGKTTVSRSKQSCTPDGKHPADPRPCARPTPRSRVDGPSNIDSGFLDSCQVVSQAFVIAVFLVLWTLLNLISRLDPLFACAFTTPLSGLPFHQVRASRNRKSLTIDYLHEQCGALGIHLTETSIVLAAAMARERPTRTCMHVSSDSAAPGYHHSSLVHAIHSQHHCAMNGPGGRNSLRVVWASRFPALAKRPDSGGTLPLNPDNIACLSQCGMIPTTAHGKWG